MEHIKVIKRRPITEAEKQIVINAAAAILATSKILDIPAAYLEAALRLSLFTVETIQDGATKDTDIKALLNQERLDAFVDTLVIVEAVKQGDPA